MKMILMILVLGINVWATDDWVAKSNENAKVMLDIMARYAPESSGQLGVEGLDEKIMDLKPDLNKRVKRDFENAITVLEQRMKKETHPAIRQDLEIMIQACHRELEGMRLEEDYEYSYVQLAEHIFSGIRALLDDQVPEERRTAAIVRLHKYAGLVKGTTPITELARDRMDEQLAKKDLRWPVKGELEQYLGNSPRYIEGVEKLFQKYEMEGYKGAFQALKEQLNAYHQYLRETYLPNARTDFRQPLELYRHSLLERGVTVEPEPLIHSARIAFMEIIQEMKALAPTVARDLGLDTDDYRVVIRELKKRQFEGDAILPHYRSRISQLEDLIRKHRVVTLPDRPMGMRLASEAESARTPAPHMEPPRLLGNTGEMGDFVLPLQIPSPDGQSNLNFDDFCFEAASWTLTVHEGRPGHELQFSSIVEKGVSTARVLFAFNSANAEGWALYMEAVMKPYLPPEGQMISLQHRLLRAARAFLDPQLQLGRISPEQAKSLLMNSVVLSEAMANQEVERYMYWAPGQATSYFFGYSNLMAIRAEMELLLGDDLNLKDLHDFILAQGLLPHDLLRKTILDEFLPAAMKKKTTVSGR